MNKYALPALFAIVVFACFVGLAYLWRVWPDQLQAAGVVASFLITVVLAAVTWHYAHSTKQMVDLLREQWKSQQAIHIRFGLGRQDGRARVWVRNLGTAHFMVSKGVIQNDEKKIETIYMHMVVHPEGKAGFFIPNSLWERHTLFCDLDVTLYYESATQAETSQSKAYNLQVGSKGVRRIYKGIRRWHAYCPKCQREGRMFNQGIITKGLANFDQALARQKEAESEFEATCPNHQSQWEITSETIKEHSRTEEVESE